MVVLGEMEGAPNHLLHQVPMAGPISSSFWGAFPAHILLLTSPSEGPSLAEQPSVGTSSFLLFSLTCVDEHKMRAFYAYVGAHQI